jgi:D-aminopeptidase
VTRTVAAVGLALFSTAVLAAAAPDSEKRPRAREIGLKVGILPPGKLNAITDVAGVLVGHRTIVQGDNVRTGVTAILPHGGNLFREKVPGAVFVGNGFGKLMGSTQVDELGEIETPILLTSTLSVPRVADFLLTYMLAQPGNEEVRSINPIVAETNDGHVVNDGRARNITQDDVLAALKNAKTGPVDEGCVGAGAGTIAFDFKGGIGTSSRKLPDNLGGYTVGVLVQTNFGGVLTINGAPVGRELGRYYLKDELAQPARSSADGSIIIVIATDAPVDALNLKRMGARAMMGMARTGGSGSNGSGDYAIAFSTAPGLRIVNGKERETPAQRHVSNEAMSPVFLAVIESTEEAIYNSLFRATTTSGCGHTIEALPLEPTIQLLKKMSLLSP